MLVHCNNGYKNAPEYYVIRTLPVFLIYISVTTTFCLAICPKFVLNFENEATLVPVLQGCLELLQGSIDVGVTRSLCAAYSEPVWVLYGLTRSIQKARAWSWRTRLHKTCIRNGSNRLLKNNYLIVWNPRILWFWNEWWRNVLHLISKSYANHVRSTFLRPMSANIILLSCFWFRLVWKIRTKVSAKPSACFFRL